jgi:carbonic anhydrase
LFVIRVAGNIVAPSQVGSVEFAAERLGTRLVVVLGHSQCGVVLSTIEALGTDPDIGRSTNLKERTPRFARRHMHSIGDRVRPSVEPLLRAGLTGEALVREAVRANVRVSANHLRHGSEILEELIARDGLVVVGAEYSLESGIVDFFDGV